MDVIGLDVGTMFMLAAKQIQGENVEIKTMRNMFLQVTDDMMDLTELDSTQLDLVESKNNKGDVESVFIISEDAYKFGNMFNQKVRRPMEKGVISPNEIEDALDVVTLMLSKLVGRTTDGYCVYSIPAQSIDIEIPPVFYHEQIFGKILKELGYESKPLNEAMAIIYSECQKEKFSGIAISYGCGLTNVACAYRGTPVMTFSISRGGDWIDTSAASSLGIVSNRVTAVKEKPSMDLLGNSTNGNKKEKRIQDAIRFYYLNLIEYTLKVFIKKFHEESDGLDIDETIPIIISGGTSKPKGFIDVFRQIFDDKFKDQFPYNISEIRPAKDQLSAVATGCLIKAVWDQKKKGASSNEE